MEKQACGQCVVKNSRITEPNSPRSQVRRENRECGLSKSPGASTSRNAAETCFVRKVARGRGLVPRLNASSALEECRLQNRRLCGKPIEITPMVSLCDHRSPDAEAEALCCLERLSQMRVRLAADSSVDGVDGVLLEIAIATVFMIKSLCARIDRRRYNKYFRTPPAVLIVVVAHLWPWVSSRNVITSRVYTSSSIAVECDKET